jgi:hypothetical protein
MIDRIVSIIADKNDLSILTNSECFFNLVSVLDSVGLYKYSNENAVNKNPASTPKNCVNEYNNAGLIFRIRLNLLTKKKLASVITTANKISNNSFRFP